jgi:hypothetical protein
MFYAPQTIQQAWNNYIPPFSNIEMGNETIANLQHTSNVISGLDPTFIQSMYAAPLPTDLPTTTPVGDMNIPGGPNPNQTSPTVGVSNIGTDSLVWHFLKLQFVGLVALVLLIVGLYLLSQQTEIGRNAKGALQDVAGGVVEGAMAA